MRKKPFDCVLMETDDADKAENELFGRKRINDQSGRGAFVSFFVLFFSFIGVSVSNLSDGHECE